MSARLRAPVLTVDAAEMRKVDPRNVETLFGMWTVFSKCAEAMEQGRRYENLSWRLWNRETFCCASNAATPAPSSPVSATRPLLPRKRLPSPAEHPPPAASLVPSSSSSSSSSPSSSSSALPSLSSSLLRPARAPTDDVPELSVSVESAVSDRDSAESHTSPLDIEHPAIRRLDSFDGRSRGHERHLTPYHLERMFNSIKTRKELQPLELSPSSRTLIVRPCKTVMMPPPRTLSPGIAEVTLAPASVEPSPRQLHLSRPISAAPASLRRQDFPLTLHTTYEEHDTAPPRRGALNEINDNDFNNDGRNIGGKVGGNSTSRHRASSPLTATSTTAVKKNVFLLGDSSGEEESSLESHMRSSLRTNVVDGPKAVPSERKQTSFNEEVVTRTIREEYDADEDKDGVFETDEDDDDDGDVVSESAIDDDDDEEDDDDDSSEWDSVTESGRSSVDEKPLFQRVDSQRPLTSRRSLLTNMLHQSQRSAAFAEAALQSNPVTSRRSRTLSPNGVSAADDDDGAAVEDAADDGHASRRRSRHGADLPRSKPIVMPPSQLHPAALSPRTTRLNMMATELTESLRKNLLWERQQKNTTASAVLRRRHTAHDVAHDQPQESSSREASKNNSWNHYYFDLGLTEYHQKGW